MTDWNVVNSSRSTGEVVTAASFLLLLCTGDEDDAVAANGTPVLLVDNGLLLEAGEEVVPEPVGVVAVLSTLWALVVVIGSFVESVAKAVVGFLLLRSTPEETLIISKFVLDVLAVVVGLVFVGFGLWDGDNVEP